VVGLSQDGPGHFELPSIETHGCILLKLIIEFVSLHRFFNAVNDLYDLVYVFFKFFSFLQRRHTNQVGLLLRQRIKSIIGLLFLGTLTCRISFM